MWVLPEVLATEGTTCGGIHDIPKEGLRNSGSGAKVLRWVEWKRSLDTAVVGIATVSTDTSDGEESPSSWVGCACDAVGGRLQEPDAVLWVPTDSAGEDDEELQQNTAGEEDEGEEAQDRA